MSALQTETVPIDTLQPHPNNPRRGNTKLIAESLNVNGQYKPIIVARDNVILAGNHTWQAAQDLDWPTIEIIRLDIDHDSDEAKRILLADNRTADNAIYDDDDLLDLLNELADADALHGSGYDQHDLEALIDMFDDQSNNGQGAEPIDLDERATATFTLRVPTGSLQLLWDTIRSANIGEESDGEVLVRLVTKR